MNELEDTRGQAFKQILNGIDVLMKTETDEKEKQNMDSIKMYFENLMWLYSTLESLKGKWAKLRSKNFSA